MRFALDSNILLYAEGVNDAARRHAAQNLLFSLRGLDVVVPVQVLAEVYAVLRRKSRRSTGEARSAIQAWTDIFGPTPTTNVAFEQALALAATTSMQIFDAIIVASASEAGCAILLSEDMQHGFEWQGVTIVNPFAPEPHPLLVAAIGAPH